MIVKRMGAVAATTGAIFDVALIAVALARTPAALTAAGGWVVQSAVLTLAAIAACVAAMWIGPLSTMDSRSGTVVGLTLGGLLAVETLTEILSPAASAANIPLGYAVVVLMALAYLVSGALG